MVIIISITNSITYYYCYYYIILFIQIKSMYMYGGKRRRMEAKMESSLILIGAGRNRWNVRKPECTGKIKLTTTTS
jgi:hypothetical protein